MPDDEANSSPIRMPSSVTAMPMRTPERISGMAAGASTVAIVATRDSRSAFAVRRCTGATLRTAFMVKMATGKYAVDDAERDLGGRAQTENQENDRVKRDLGNRIDGAEDRIGDIGGEATEADHKPKHQPTDDADGARIGKSRPGTRRVVPEILGPLTAQQPA